MRPAGLALLLLSLAAPAAEPIAAPVAAPPETSTRVLEPLHLDLRASVDTDVLLLYVDLAATADIGLLPLGAGTLAVGAELDFGFCGTLCGLISLAGLDYGQRYYSPYARVSYHHRLMNQPSLAKADLYAVAMAGIVHTTAGISDKSNTFAYDGVDTSFAVGLGAGGNYFVNDHLFVGIEGRLRYARGTYAWTVRFGNYSISDSQSTWDLSGLNLLFFLGYRI